MTENENATMNKWSHKTK